MGCSENTEPVMIKETAFKLVADPSTGVIYIKNHTYHNNYVYTPYYSKNGKLCKYEDGEIVEIKDRKETKDGE